MAKKVVATLKDKTKVGMTKVVRAVKNERGNYSFREDIVMDDQLQEFLKNAQGK